jgi:FkbM family methyltransferase
MDSDLIYDVGLSTGQDAGFYLKKGFRVVGIEANPVLVEECRSKFSGDVSAGRLTLINVGIGSKAGQFTFYLNKTHHEWSSLIESIGARGGQFDTVGVEVVTLDTILETHGVPYYLKIDIEGMDNAAVQAAGRLDDRPRYISVETGPKPVWIDTLHDISYRWFKLIDQTTIDRLSCPEPAREGRSVAHQFVRGSTGPFGEDTPGEWKSYEEVRQEWLAYLANPDPNKNLWFDVHAKLA